MGLRSRICAALCLIVAITFPAVTFGQRISQRSYQEMRPGFQRSKSRPPAQQDIDDIDEQIDTVSYEVDDEGCQFGCGDCVDCGCGCCVDSCCGCGSGGGFGGRGGIYVLYENVIVQPFFTRSTAYYLEDPPPLNDGYQEVPFEWDFSYSPRVELGALFDGGLGARVRYWYFEGDEGLAANDANGDIFASFGDDSISFIGIDGATAAFFTHSLKMNVVDMEAVVQKSNWICSGGLRYAQMEQLYTGVETAPGSDTFRSGHDFEGWGLTVATEVRGPSYGGISVFAKVRGSYIYGTSDFFATNGDNDALLADVNNDDLISVGEIQLGVDWQTYFSSGASAFISLAAEGQYWNNAGTGGPANNAPYDEGNYQNARPQDADLGFFGVTVGAGVMF